MMKKLIYGLAAFVSMGVLAGQTNVTIAVGAQDKGRNERKGPPSMTEMRERIETMAKEEPEKFAQMTNRMARWRQRRLERVNAKLEFLKSVDTNGMTDMQKQTHDKYQNLIARHEQLEEKIQNPKMTDEARADVMRDMRETDRMMRQLSQQEREILMWKELKSLGLPDEKLTNVCMAIGNIIRVTAPNSNFSVPLPKTGSR